MMRNNFESKITPFEIIIDLWSYRADDHDAVDEDNFLNLFIDSAPNAVVPVEEMPVIATAISGVIKLPILCGPKLTCI